jgi:sodium borate transporter 11
LVYFYKIDHFCEVGAAVFFVRALADIDEHVEEGHVYDIIVKVRETRISNLISNTLIGLSVYLIPRSFHFA